ncbi:MAG: hypothetical protein HY866_18585 [Chloroflexi bacterium]|nr:hypothetical protein [Chloroflexota bacterium]
MDDIAREQLAKRLSALSLKDARKEIRSLDPDADMAFWRNATWDEHQTLWLLPNAELSITLVEKTDFKDSNHQIGGGPGRYTAQKADYRYIEARVMPLERPAKNHSRP